jgi:hypothetical protein
MMALEHIFLLKRLGGHQHSSLLSAVWMTKQKKVSKVCPTDNLSPSAKVTKKFEFPAKI